MENKTVFILNYASHYRSVIYKKINEELNADFYFGDIPGSNIKKIDYSILSNFKKEFKTFKLKNFYWYTGSIRLVFKNYKNIVLTGDPQIISNWGILLYAKLLGKKTYLWTHGWYGDENLIKRIIKRFYFNLADIIFLYGDYAKIKMINAGFKPEKLVPIYNSLDYETQVLIRREIKKSNIYIEHFKNNFPVLIFIGRIQKSKKIELLIEALILLNKNNFFLNLVLVGGETKGYDVKQMVENSNLQNQVWFYGPCYDEIKNAELLYNADLCVSPGNVGLTALHSLTYGTPVIAHNSFESQGPEFETIIEKKTGAFFKENDVMDLARKIKLLIENPLDKKECYKIIDKKWNPHYQINILKNTLNAPTR
tara:strand:- start:8403 stop:9503 length:1101 start_codon:yes stop_codon:yes gene_type:complete